VSATSRPSPDRVLTVVSALSGISLDALRSASQLCKLGLARAAAVYLLRVDGGLSVAQVAPLLGRSPQTICEFSRKARLAIDQRGAIAELIQQARQVLDASRRALSATTPEPAPAPGPVGPAGKPRALPAPHLAEWRARAV
jgi:hypothetical protein